MAKKKTFSLRVERTILAKRADVFRAWITPELLKQWLHAGEGWTTPIAEMDVRVGGRFRWGIRGPDGGTFYEVGEFLDITPPERLVYTCRFEDDEVDFQMPKDETIVRVDFIDVPGGTRVTLVSDGYSKANERDDHQNGWPGFLANLALLVERDARRTATTAS
jgi:uncharacterized protein YndB with AHSA1/START domain